MRKSIMLVDNDWAIEILKLPSLEVFERLEIDQSSISYNIQELVNQNKHLKKCSKLQLKTNLKFDVNIPNLEILE